MGLVLTGCPPCNPIYWDYGTLPAEALELVPYQDGISYTFAHSAGQEIHFLASRESIKEENYMVPCGSVSFEQNTTKLVPDYPIFNMGIMITKNDTIHYSLGISVSNTIFMLPIYEGWEKNHVYLDSLRLDHRWFYEVYRIKRHDYYSSSEELTGIFPDSLWYNSRFGILKVLMSNDEYYQVIPSND